MSRNRTRDQHATSDPAPTSDPAADGADLVTSDPDPAADLVTVDPDPAADLVTVDPEPTSDPAADGGTSDPDPAPTSDPAADAQKRADLVAALSAAWRAAAESSDTGTVPAADLVSTFSAFSAVCAVVTRPTERAAVVATIAADLSAEFIAAGNVLPALAVHGIRGELDKKTTKVLVMADPTRDNAISYLVAALAFQVIAEKTTDDEKAVAATIPADDPAFTAMAEKVMSALTKKASARGKSGTSTSGPRKVAESLDSVLLAIPAGETVPLSKVAKDSGRSPGALTNAHDAMVAGTRTIAGVSAVVTADGKKAFTRAA